MAPPSAYCSDEANGSGAFVRGTSCHVAQWQWREGFRRQGETGHLNLESLFRELKGTTLYHGGCEGRLLDSTLERSMARLCPSAVVLG